MKEVLTKLDAINGDLLTNNEFVKALENWIIYAEDWLENETIPEVKTGLGLIIQGYKILLKQVYLEG